MPSSEILKPIRRRELPPGRYFNRELSWLAFNKRVLNEAAETDQPLLERIKFLSIFSSNLDEFFMIRISGLREQVHEGINKKSQDGLTPKEQLREINRRLRPLLKRQETLTKNTLGALQDHGISIEKYEDLDLKDRRRLTKFFRERLFPLLTPQAVDSSHPFPYVSNLSLNLGLFIEPSGKRVKKNLRHLFKQRRFARVKLPASVPRLVRLSDKTPRFVLLEEVIAANIGELFPKMNTSQPFLFRVTRDADIEVREEEAMDLLRTMETEVRRRRFGSAVRLEISAEADREVIRLLGTEIGLTSDEIYKIEGFLNIADLYKLCSIEIEGLHNPPISPSIPKALKTEDDIFKLIKRGDVLLHHPYHSFSVVSDMISLAAEDPEVQAIKICLYRTGKDSPIVHSLITAARNGKQVTALVELKARFDEENNIEWAKMLEKEGVHVVYGISGLKTHSKVLLIARREGRKLVRYSHIGTGNYNPQTAKQYTDLGILTADPEIAADVTDLFNFLTGYSQQSDYHRLVVAPLNMREKLIKLVRNEGVQKRKGKDAQIIMKLNSLTDAKMIDELYEASRAGVKIDLIVRGICALKPGVSGMSETIRVRSIVGRFLEHSRIFFFRNGGEESLFIGSADLMVRNLDNRVEVLVPILDSDSRKHLRDVVLDAYLKDTVNASELRSDGKYLRVGQQGPRNDSQSVFFEDLE